MIKYFTAMSLLLAASCEQGHPAKSAVDDFANALKYGDVDGLFAAHVDSTRQGEFCRKEFRDLLEKARMLDEEGCAQVRQLTGLAEAAAKPVPDELQLAAQTGRWVCENPEGTCVDYARTVFDQHAANSELLREAVTSVSVRKLMGDESTAVAYLDIGSQSGAKYHRTLKLKLVGEGWRVTGGFLAP